MKKLLTAALLASFALPAHAKITSVLPDNSTTAEVVVISGEIKYEDEKVLEQVLAKIAAKNHTVRGVIFDSEGGNVIAAAGIADLIHHNGYNTYVHEGSICASACFLSWAAGKTRYFRGNAQIGVHNVTINGEEDADAAKVTIVMIQALKDYGVTPNILGKLAATSASDVSWLSKSELTDMGATYLPPMNAPTPAAQPVTAAVTAPRAEGSEPVRAPAAASSVIKSDGSIDFHGSWMEFAALAEKWSARDHDGKANTWRTDRKDGSHTLDLTYRGSKGKWVQVTENFPATGKPTAWFCVFDDTSHKSCVGWGTGDYAEYVQTGNRWVKK